VVITVIGSGGKTSLIWRLAASFAAQNGRKVLVSPTTKMFVPAPKEKIYDRYYNYNLTQNIKPEPGITLAGCFNESSSKLESLPDKTLNQLIADYDITLIEGDGAKGLPLKAWNKDEPVVPPFTTLTIGVLPLWVLGKTVSEKLVHRLPLFLELTGAVEGESITPEHFVSIITGNKTQPGLFAKARGKKLLYFSDADSNDAVRQGQEIENLLPAEFRDGLNGIITGCVLSDYLSALTDP